MNDNATGMPMAPPPTGHVVVVDDEAEMRRLIAVSLATQGWETSEVATGGEALEILGRRDVAAVTLDVNLALESGYDVCRRIRAVSDVPILFLTARSDEFDHVLGLELGADDYVTKPFAPRVLAARVAAIVRRRALPAPPSALEAGPVRIDLESRRATLGGNPLVLSKSEFDLLVVLMGDRRAFSRAELLERIWSPWRADEDLTVLVSRVRRKLAEGGASDLIETVHGVGYRLADLARI